MSYKEILQNQIRELEEKIVKFEGDKSILMDQLQKLKRDEFEEDIRESDNKQLLKG
jgi:hypothetical protein